MGGTMFLERDGKYYGPGCLGYFPEGENEYISYHYYDGDDDGHSKLKIARIDWVYGRPVKR